QPPQARHQDHRAQTLHRQQQAQPGSGHDRRGHGPEVESRRLVMAENHVNGNGAQDFASRPKAIQVVNIVKRFGNFTAVDGVSFEAAEGEVFGLRAPKGAGKSTLIRMMTTLLPINDGTAMLEGFDVRKDPDKARRSIGVIPQAMTSDGDLTVWENLSIYSKLYGIAPADREKSIDELLELVDLTQWRDAPARNLSGGMRRRLEIARG